VFEQGKWNFVLFQEGLYVDVIFVRYNLARYASFYSAGCEAYRMEILMQILVQSSHVTLKVMVKDYRRDFLSGCS
jgi:hypothetical protein